jgi:hypothetical protein
MQRRLPVGVAAFVGREGERAKLADLVADARVVTSRFSDGACWVHLESRGSRLIY